MRKFLFVLIVFVITACGTTQHSIKLEEGYDPHEDARVTVGSVSNETDQVFDVDVEKMLTKALIEKLQAHDLFCERMQDHDLAINAKITEYAKGDAFKRWLLPGYGSTVLSVESELVDSKNNVIGRVQARRSVDAGGAYTVGAWESIFTNVAHDVVDDLEAQVRRQSNEQ